MTIIGQVLYAGFVCVVVLLTATFGPAPISIAARFDVEQQFLPKWASASTSATASTYQASGIVEAIDRERGSLTVEHGPMQTMGWPTWIDARYVVEDVTLLSGVAAGQKVRLIFRKRGVELEAIAISRM